MKLIDIQYKAIAIHCNTEEKSILLLEKIKEILPEDDYEIESYFRYKENTCYDLDFTLTKEWNYNHIIFYRRSNYEIIKFEDLDDFKDKKEKK